MKHLVKKSVSILLAIVMIVSEFTIIPASASAAVDESVVDKLTSLYDGDDERARTDLSLLYDAGVIDEDGNMVSLDIRENGESVELNDLVERIAGDKTVGALTVNGNKATTEQITKIQKVKAALEIVKALDKDTEITDEHVENLQKLLEGVVDGSIDIEKAIDSGTLSLAGSLNDDASDELDEDGFPTTKTGTGEVEAEEGKYTQPLINGSTYNESYDFTLPNAKNTTYYTDSRYESTGATEGVVTMSRSGTTVTAKLNKALTVPVSFEWKAVSGGAEATGSGTVTIPAGQTQGSFTFEQSGSGWSGNCVYYVEAGSLKNAVFSDGKTVWSEEVTYSRSDSIQYARADDLIDPSSTQNNPYRTVVSTNNSGTWVYGIPSYDIFPDIQVGSFKLVVRTDRAVTGDVTVRLISNRGIFPGDVNASNISYTKLQNASYWSEYYGIYSSQVSLIQDTSSTTPRYYFNISRSSVGLGNLEGTDWKTYGFYENPPGYIIRLPQDYNAQIIGIGVEKEAPLTDVQATVSVPQGTYYSGQKVPVTATFNEYMQNSGSLTMKINGEDCPLAAGSSGISKKMTFVYTVKDVDTGSISVSGLSEGFKNGKGSAATVSLTEKSFGAAQGVKIVSDVKRSALDLDNIKYGIDDNDSGDQLVTVLIPFKSGASLNWVGSETVAVNSGNGFTTSLPGYPSTLIRDYVAGMYFSLDGGKTRYPAYVVRSTDGEEKPLALAAKFNAPANPTVYLRKDTLEMFVDGNIVTDPATYMCAWDDMKTDGKGYAYSTSTANSEGCFTGWSYYVKGGVFFTEDGYVSRGEADYSSAVVNGFLKLNDGYYVQLADHSDHPERRHDVEILVSEGFYDAVCGAHSEEELKPMKLEYQISDRKNFTFTDAKDFRWISDNEEVATITEEVKNGKTVATVARTGKTGTAGITLKVDNGGVSYELFAGSVVLLDGLTPFFNIPTFSKNRTTLTGTDTNILFSTNLTARNAEFGAGETKFSAELYDSSNTKTWSDEYTSTVAQTVTHVTIPGDELMNPGTYTVKIFGEYKGTEANIPASWSDTATLTVKRAPVSVRLDKLDSYYVTSLHVPSELSYTVSNDSATVKYTIQKSGQAVSEMKTPATAGVIPFPAGKPSGLKEAYTVTVYARNDDDEEWSVDSLLLTVYNEDILDVVVADVAPGAIGGTTGGTGDSMNGKTITMNNADKAQGYVNESGYQLSFEDFTALRTDISLQKVISANYGAGVWGMLSDRIKWESDDPELVSVDYEQGGLYSDIRNYSYTSYAPATDFLLVGKGDTADSVTIKATHANTGMEASIKVNAKTLKDHLYLFQFYPRTTTTVIYKNGDGVRRQLTSNEQGELAVYEESGIASDVQTMSTYPDPDNESLMDTYVGTILQKHLDSGERDVASLQLYACNNLRLRRINKVTLVFRNTDGTAYNGDVTIHGGVYKNDLYCPVATIKTDRAGEAHSGIDGVTGTVANGKLDLYFDPSTFRYDSGDEQALPGDNITYVLEYTTEDCRPGIAVIYSYSDVTGLVRDSNAVAQLTKLSGSSSSPQIITQSMQQYYSENGHAVPMSYARDVLAYTEPLGLSRQVSKVMLTGEVALTNEPVEKDGNGYSTFSGEKAYSFALCKPDGKELTDAAAEGGVQPRNTYAAATQITDLKDFAGSTLYVFPFSTFAVARGSYTMDDASLTADGITDGGSEASFSTENSQSGAMVALYYGDEITKGEKMPYIISNLSHQPDVAASVKESGTEIKSNVQSKADIGSIFSSIDVNDMIKKGVIFLGGLTGKAGDKMMNMLILPTEDPASFQIMVFIGYNKRAQKSEEGKLNVEFDPDQMYDDIDKFDEAMSDMFKDEDDDDDDDDDDEGGGEASVKFNFYGTLTLDAHLGIKDGNWDIRFAGGDIGTNFAVGYEWSQNFMCGPVPVFVSFEVGAHADLELGFASIDDVREMLLDAAMGVSIEAFAGLGFDMSLIAFQLGIFGKISADVNFLYLTRSDQSGSITSNNGTKLDIAGEIGLRMKVKILCISYSKTFCSTGFNWSKTWGKYNEILDAWESGSPAEIKGVTANGRAYKMALTPTGTAMITIDGEGELENRDYLDDGMRLWNVGFPSLKGLFSLAGSGANALTDVQSNAYPYANPVFTDDGEMFLYLSDNNNAEERQSVISYAVKNVVGYTDRGRLDVSDEVLSDSSISASGTGNNLFTTWVKQEQMPVKEKSDTTASFDELGLMLNSTEIYAGAYNGSEWNVTRLTDNFNADMAPVVASSGDHAIVTWRNLDASQMPEYGTDMDLTAMFNVENTVRYRIYNGSEWTDAQVAYNGATGTVNAIDAAMLPNGTALLAYTVRTGEELTSTETFYTVINSTGKVLTTVRLTNDNAIDTNAKVAALGDQFVLGWYSEQGAVKEDGSSTHDVRLARVNANGSVDADFPESIGGEVSPIGSDFRFAQPAGNSDLSKLSIIWSQAASGDDDGKYELDAVRFYQQNGAVGVTAPAQISLTDKGFKIDHFDAYTDSEDTIHTLILGSDYTNIVGLDVYDSIDLSNLPISTSNSADPSADHLDILAQETLSSIKLGSGSFAPADIEVSGDANLKDLMPGLNLPVQFSVKNTGLSKVDTITVSGAANKEFTNLNLLPNETKTLVVSYPVPENSVQDVAFEITPGGGDTKTVNLTLNRPDVGIAGMKLMREELGQRDIQVTLANATGIPLQGSGKIVKLGLYKDSVHTQQLDLITISDDSDLSDIDAGYYAAVRTLNVRDLIGSASEIPDSGVSVYAHAWVEGGDGERVDELNPHDNDNSVFFHGLLTKNNGEKVTNDIQFEKSDDGYVVYATIRNNSLQTRIAGSPSAVLYDSEGNVIAQKELTLDRSTLSGEEQISSEPLTFTADEVSGKPVRAAFSTVSYIENGEEKTVDKYKILSSSDTNLISGWYIVEDAVTISGRINISGDVHLILADGAKLTAQSGIQLSGNNTLSVYGQTEGTGKLSASPSDITDAAIGTTYKSGFSATLNVYGGNITATSTHGAGIGSGRRGDFTGEVTVNGGTVTATSTLGAGIGNGSDGSYNGTLKLGPGVGLRDASGGVIVNPSDQEQIVTNRAGYMQSFAKGVLTADDMIVHLEDTDVKINAKFNSVGTLSYAVKSGDAVTVDDQGNLTLLKEGTSVITITATQSGSDAVTKDVTVTVVVIKPQTITPDNLTVYIDDTDVNLNAKTSGDGALSYALKSGDAVTVDDEGNLTIVKLGTAVITVTAAETFYYKETSKDITVTVIKRPQTITPSEMTVYIDDANVNLNARTSGDGALSYAVKSGDAVTVDDEGNLTLVKKGTAVITVTAAETDVYAAASKDVTVTVLKHTQTITAADMTVMLDDTNAKVTASTSGDGALSYAVKKGEAVTVDEQGNITPVKGGYVVVTITAAETDLYDEATKDIYVKLFEPVSYLDEDGVEQTVTDFDYITESTKGLGTGWYVVSDDITLSNRLNINGDVRLILCDGDALKVSGVGLGGGNTLRVYGQTEGIGKLTGGSIGNGGALYLYGGEVSANNGGDWAEPAINLQDVVIYGGKLSATADDGAAIGSGYNSSYSGNVTVYGGTVNVSADYGAGIGGAQLGGFTGTVTINGGTVTARSNRGSAIGAGRSGSGSGTLKLGAGVGLRNASGETIVTPAGQEQTVTDRPGYLQSFFTTVITADNMTLHIDDTTAKLNAGTNSDGALSYAVKSGDAVTVDDEGNITVVRPGTSVITITAAKTDNFDSATKDVTVTVIGRQYQTIMANNMTVYIDDTDVNLNAKTSGDGALSYALKSGDAVTVDDEGNITVVRPGTSVITITAAKTYSYEAASKDVSVSVTKHSQTITAADITAHFGDTGLKIVAETDGGGALSYALKSGNAVTVDDEGNITPVKGGTAVITITAAETDLYDRATKDISVVVFADGVTFTYLDEDGIEQTVTEFDYITAGSATLSEGWYVVDVSITLSNRLSVTGDVRLILCDGAALNATKGIGLTGNNSLTIYGQTEGTGELTASAPGENDAAIGSGEDEEYSGVLTIIGGIVTTNSDDGAGIGSGDNGAFSGKVIINGGSVTANSGDGAGIGSGHGGEFTGEVTVNGGSVTANSSSVGAGIGSGCIGDFTGNVTVNGGSVTANCYSGAGIGSGLWGEFTGEVTVNGGSVTANCDSGAGIGSGGDGEFAGNVTINGGDVITSSEGGKGIGAGDGGHNSGTLKLGAGVGLIDGSNKTLAKPAEQEQIVTKRASTMKTGVGEDSDDPTESVTFIKVPDADELDSALAAIVNCTEDDARDWIDAHEDELDATGHRAYIVFSSSQEDEDRYQYFIRETEGYILGPRDSMARDILMDMQDTDEELDVYVAGTEGGETSVVTFNKVSDISELDSALAAIVNCTEDEAKEWINDHEDELDATGHMACIVFSSSKKNEGWYQYFIRDTDGDIRRSYNSPVEIMLRDMQDFSEEFDVYVAGREGSQTDAVIFNKVSDISELDSALAAIVNCTEDEAKEWINANIDNLNLYTTVVYSSEQDGYLVLDLDHGDIIGPGYAFAEDMLMKMQHYGEEFDLYVAGRGGSQTDAVTFTKVPDPSKIDAALAAIVNCTEAEARAWINANIDNLNLHNTVVYSSEQDGYLVLYLDDGDIMGPGYDFAEDMLMKMQHYGEEFDLYVAGRGGENPPSYDEGYYIVGSMTDWQIDDAYMLTENTAADTTEFMFTELTLSANDQIKVVKYTSGEDLIWYPDDTDNYYQITADGTYDVYFRPNGDGGDGWFNNRIYVTPATYTITWENDDGSVIDTTKVAYGEVPTHDEPTKAADAENTYTFSGWTPEVVAVTGDVTYTATFESAKRSYTITWKNDDGSVIDTTTVEYGETPAHSDPVKDNHNFLGWSPAVTPVTGDAEYTATYSEAVKEYTVTWMNGDEILKTVTVTNGETPSYDGETPTKAADTENTYTFSGWTPTVDGEGNITYTAAFTAIPKLFVAHSISLGGNIGVNFYINSTAADFANAKTATVKFTWDDGNCTAEVDLKKLTPDDKSWYKATCDVVAAQMAHKIHAEVYLDGEKLDATVDFSVQDYAETVFANPEKYDSEKPEQLKALAKALLNYGAQAQIVFDSSLTEKPDPAKTVEVVGQTDFSDVTVEKIQNAINAANPDKITSDLNEVAAELSAKYYTSSLIYLSKNTLRIYFTPVEGSMTMTNTEAYDGNLSDYYYYAEKANIAASELDNLQEFKVGNTTFYFSALDYAKAVINSDKMSEDQHNLAKSLYLYNQAANAYFD